METNHNAIRGKSDCFSQLTDLLDRLNRTDKHITAVTTLTRANIGDIEALSGFLTKNHVKIWQLQTCSPFGNAKDNTGMAPRKEDIVKVVEIFQKLPQIPMRTQLADNIGYYVTAPDGGTIKQFRGCAAGLLSIGIDSDGSVRGCESLKDDCFIEGNLRTKTLKEIWEGADSFSYNRKFSPGQLTGACAACEFGERCAGGCRSHNLFSHSKLYESTVCAKNL